MIDYYGRRELIKAAAQKYARQKSRVALLEVTTTPTTVPEPKPKRTPRPRPTGTQWKANGSLGITILGCTKQEALRIIEQAFASCCVDEQAEGRVKCAIQIFEKIAE